MDGMRAPTVIVTAALAALAGCGQHPGGGGDGDGGSGGDAAWPGGDGGLPADDLETPTGCDGPYNPGQVLTYRITTGGTFPGRGELDDYGAGTFACGDEAPINVGVKLRGTGEGWLVDINWAVAGQRWRDLKKLSFHTGFNSDVTIEYTAWRLMRLGGGPMLQRSALAHVIVDGVDRGILFNLEQIDKRFLRSRVGDSTGWLYKKSGIDDGYRTNETVANPYEAQWCIFDESQPCPPPADLETWLPAHLAMDQLMTFGAISMIMGNSDGPLTKPHNFYSYDYSAGPRYYWPWDLDSSWGQPIDPFGGPGASSFQDVLFTYWQDDYAAIILGLLDGPLTTAAVTAEIDRAIDVGGGAVSPSAAGGYETWYAERHDSLAAQVAAGP
jgi:CotH protein